MKSRNLFKLIAMSTLVLGSIVTGAVPSVAPTIVYAASTQHPSPNGVSTLGNGNASITIKPHNGQSLAGKRFEVYKLFNAENAKDGESINYTWNTTYKTALQTVVGKKLNKTASTVTEYEVIDYMQTMNSNPVEGTQADQTLEGRYSDYRYFVEELRNEMVKEGVEGETVYVTMTQIDGSVKIAGLDYGYYLTDEITDVQSTHAAASLILLQTANPNASVQIKSDFPSVEKKIAEDDNGTGWNDIADYEIGQTVPYRYTTNVPDMNGYHTYYFAFHDVMDEALTFNRNSVSIVIDNGTKSYTLKDTEFMIEENISGDTYKISILDLKRIVDTQFPEGLNGNNENRYGQLVTLHYNATLNDKAAARTGRAGFENAVRLEFSNDPDSDGIGHTGMTPWDTVVCFTYKINGLKINNHDKVLEGAKFRLYSDAKCTEEVYLKEGNDGYIVINRDSVGGSDHTGGTRPSTSVEMVSDVDGVFTIFGLDQGTYYLKETDSPDGYRELLDPITITITPTFTTDRQHYAAGESATAKTLQALSATAHKKEFLSGAFKEGTTDLVTDVEAGSANITVVNQVGTKLPITGSSMTLIMLAAGTVIMTGSLAYSRKSRKKEEEE